MIGIPLILMGIAQIEQVGVRGSFVLTAICKDGIIVASESRANIFDTADKQQSPIAYYDTIQKVFPLGANALAETGQGLILGRFVSAIVQDFSKGTTTPLLVDNLLPSFLEYCRRAYPTQAVAQIRRQKMFAAGYKQGIPTLCYFNEDQPSGPFGCIQGSGFIGSAPTLLTEYSAKLSSMSAGEAAALSEKAILEYARQDNRWKTMGGPISILLVTPFGSEWLKNPPAPQKWQSTQDMITAYRAGDFVLQLIPPATKKQLEELFATVPQGPSKK